jgi:hypothetical protein
MHCFRMQQSDNAKGIRFQVSPVLVCIGPPKKISWVLRQLCGIYLTLQPTG